MPDLSPLLEDLVVANHILAHENVVDGYGHVSIRHPDRPDRFFISVSRAPELVTREDIVELDLDCRPVAPETRTLYLEVPIHGAIYQARPDVMAVIHNHAHEVIPYSTSKVRLRPITHTAGIIGSDIPVWDIRDRFGDTDMLVRTLDQGRDLAARLGKNRVVLMRGHGCVVATEALKTAVQAAVYLMVNARVQTEAMKLGDNVFLSDGEIAEIQRRQVPAVVAPAPRAPR
jgi:ribulose-5-phosphate 4-epimerase/fuculose-1-phosphate aldolase